MQGKQKMPQKEMEDRKMQQNDVVITQDNERMVQILTELVRADKEFQIVIKVPQ